MLAAAVLDKTSEPVRCQPFCGATLAPVLPTNPLSKLNSTELLVSPTATARLFAAACGDPLVTVTLVELAAVFSPI